MTDTPTQERGQRAAVLLALVLLAVLAAAGRGAIGPLSALFSRADALCWLAVLLLGALGQGSFLLEAIGGLPRGGPSVTLGALGLGLGVFALETLVLGVAGLLGPRYLTLLALAVLGATYRRWRAAIVQAAASLRAALPGLQGGGAVPLTLAGASAVALLPFALAPTRDFDALVYHLEVPSRYLQAGRVLTLPDSVPSNYPLLTEMLYALGLGLDGYDLAALLSWAFFPATLAVLWTWARGRFGTVAASWGAALLALTPAFLTDATRMGSDWSAAFFTLSAVLALSAGAPTGTGFAAAGALAGMAAGCKYPALGFAILAPAAALAAAFLGRRARIPLRALAAFLLGALSAAAPWYAKSWVLTGDPFYPLLGAGGAAVGALAADAHFAPPVLADLWRWALAPLTATLEPERFQLSASLGLVPLALVPLLWLLRGGGPRRDDGGGRFLGWWAALAFAAWYLTFRVGRFALPMYALGAALLGAGLSRALARPAPAARALLAAVALALALQFALFLGIQAAVNDNAAVAVGLEAPGDYLDRTHDAFPAIAFLNALEPPPRKVLFLGETRGFYAAFPREVPTFDAPHRLVDLLRAGSSPEEAAAELRKAGFSHLLVNPRELSRLGRASPRLRLDAAGGAALNALLARLRPVYTSAAVVVWEIPGG